MLVKVEKNKLLCEKNLTTHVIECILIVWIVTSLKKKVHMKMQFMLHSAA